MQIITKIDVSATLDSPDGQVIEARITPEWMLAFIPTVGGTYICHLSLKGESVDLVVPFKVEVVAGEPTLQIIPVGDPCDVRYSYFSHYPYYYFFF